MTTPARRPLLSGLRHRLHLILDGGAGSKAARAVHGVLVTLVTLSVASVVLESVPSLAAEYGSIFLAVEYVAVAVFSVEYLLRIWCAPEHTLYAGLGPIASRWAFLRSPSALIDLVTLLPVYVSFFIAADLRILLFLRILRFLKLARYSPGIRSLIAVIEAERKALAATGIVLLGVILLTAAAMHVAEHEAQPDAFGSIPASMWWAVQTVATVGYGDVTPVTPVGRMIAAFAMLLGFVMLGLPVGIVATAFAEEIHRREFVVTWSMVASVPLFRPLDAPAIAEIMRYLRAQSVPAGTLITRRGEIAHSMYFIASGEVEIELADNNVRLGEGQFFGEAAVLRRTRRTANVRALEPTRLLVLDTFDLQTLMQRNPEIGMRIEEIAASRTEFATQKSHGDIIDAELLRSDDPPRDPNE